MACLRCQTLREGVLVEGCHNDEWVICSIFSCGEHEQSMQTEDCCNFYMFLIKVNTKTVLDPICCSEYDTKWRFLSNSLIAQPITAECDDKQNNSNCNPSKSAVNELPKVIMKSQQTQTPKIEDKLPLPDLNRFHQNSNSQKRKRSKPHKTHSINSNDNEVQMNPSKKRKVMECDENDDDKLLDHYIKCLIGHALGNNEVGSKPFVEQPTLDPPKKKKRKTRPIKREIKSMSMHIDDLSDDCSVKQPKINIVTNAVICPVCSKSYQKHAHFMSHIKQKQDALHRDYRRKHSLGTN